MFVEEIIGIFCPLLNIAFSLSSTVIDGLGMLVGQAAVSFAIWREVKPEVTPVINQLKKE